jgi:hypothetical protein
MGWALSYAVGAVLLLASAPAHGDEPWKQGVTPERQAAAQALLEEGNAQFLERNYAAALTKYEAALEVWDHPAIRYNMVRALVYLDRYVEAYDNLELALKYGGDPLEATVYEEALSYRKLLVGRVAKLVITCTQDDVRVTLDGQPVLTCPGQAVRTVLPGHHQLVGKKPHHLTRTLEITAQGGKDESVSLSLQQVSTSSSAWTTKRVVAVGLGAVAVISLGTGIGLGIAAENKESQAYAFCPDPDVPCSDSERSNELVRSGHRLATGANVSFGVAALAIVGGTVLWFIGAPARQSGVAIAPQHNGFSIVGHF